MPTRIVVKNLERPPGVKFTSFVGKVTRFNWAAVGTASAPRDHHPAPLAKERAIPFRQLPRIGEQVVMPDVKDQKEKNRRSDKEYSSTGRLETGGALTTTKRM